MSAPWRVGRNALSNYLGKLVALASAVLLTPLILQHLGATGYALWVLVGSVTGYGALLDLGLSSAIVKYVAEYRATAHLDQARQLIATALRLYSALGLLALVVAAIAAPLVPQILQLPASERPTAAQLGLLAGIAVGFGLPCSTVGAVLRGLHRFDLLNVISLASTLLSTAGSVLVLLLGGGVVGLMLVNIGVMLALQAPSIWLLGSAAPELRFGWRGSTRKHAAQVFRFGSWVFMVDLASRLQAKTDEIVIGLFLPVAAITPYAIANRMAEVPQILTDQFLKLLLPRAAELHVTDELSRMRGLYLTSTRLTLAALVAIGGTLTLVAGPLLKVWVGPAYSDAAVLVAVLVLASAINTSQWPAASILQAMARHRVLAVSSMASAVANIVLSIVLLRWLGLMGVAIGTLVPTALECLGFVLPYTAHVLGVRRTELARQVLLPTLLPAIAMASLTSVLMSRTRPESLADILLVSFVALATYASTYLLSGASAAERRTYAVLWNEALAVTHARLKSATSSLGRPDG